ncbi:hypothetical protein [Futiania mangrovi]|uniref:Uncharacterized protein n=1 Tax=Futiania mangrovi TaxID=2959716 RepID=A0A9J6PHN7_9PROT|nr:hypothetical protein [Futiania mangrovii]MCP1336087.1 hypothetical protein [Futiania mangrovii]
MDGALTFLLFGGGIAVVLLVILRATGTEIGFGVGWDNDGDCGGDGGGGD